MKFLALDFETANSNRSSVCQIGLLKYENNSFTEIINTLIDPKTDFLPVNTKVHGIKEHHINGCPEFSQFIGDFIGHLEGEFVASHSDFDNQVLKQIFEANGLNPISYKKIDTHKVAKDVWPNLENHKLDTVCKFLGIDIYDHHHAYFDATASAKILIEAIAQSGKELNYFADLSGPKLSAKKPFYKSSGDLKRSRKVIFFVIAFALQVMLGFLIQNSLRLILLQRMDLMLKVH